MPGILATCARLPVRPSGSGKGGLTFNTLKIVILHFTHMNILNRTTLIIFMLLSMSIGLYGLESKQANILCYEVWGKTFELHAARVEVLVVSNGSSKVIWPAVSSASPTVLLDKETLLFSGIREGDDTVDRVLIVNKDGLVADITSIFTANLGPKSEFYRYEDSGDDIKAEIYIGRGEKWVKISKKAVIRAGKKKWLHGVKQKEFGYEFYE
jgi:hypothetical protein